MSEYATCSEHNTSIPPLDEVIIRNQTSQKVLSGDTLRAAVFNIERGFGLEPLLIYLKEHPLLKTADVILANELDWGMKRTKNRNIAALIAEATNLNYAYGIEFVALDGEKSGNKEALHGNAVFSRFPILKAGLLRLPRVFDWRESDQPRLGGRNAVFAVVEFAGRQIGLSSVHLENRTVPSGRLKQMECFLNGVNDFFADMPVILGGDMNTNCMNGADNAEALMLAQNQSEQRRRIKEVESIEPLLHYAQERGFDYKGCNLIDKTTRRKPIKGEKDLLLNLDWFFMRGFTASNPQVVNTVFDEKALGPLSRYAEWQGTQISDHDAVVADFQLA